MARRTSSLFLLSLLLALPMAAADGAHGREQSYFTYDDGGTTLKQGDDGREIEARVNLPLYPGDEVTTGRSGRTEIRLSDGNVLALDRSTTVHFKSILDSYDGDNTQTVVDLRAGHVAVQRTNIGQDFVRLDTDNASYVAYDEAIYSIEADGHGKDRIQVFDGSIEVRTPSRTLRVRSGEEARVDDQGLFGLVSLPRGSGDEFERWFINRSERSGGSSRYLDQNIAYANPDLDEYGSWVYVGGYSTWCWRPHVTTSWRPYYNGYWHRSPSGVLVWVSSEPWGWAPYHYGRWSYDTFYGWVWMPGSAYAPAWVYWMYGSTYVGWAPMGWYDCYRPYYSWAYRPYQHAGLDHGWGGRVRVGDIDLRPWTFMAPNTVISTRVDRAALTTDIIRDRLRRDPGAGMAAIGSEPARFTHSDLKDPAAAIGNIVRRGIGSGTGTGGSGSAVDMTPYFRRDPEIPTTVRDRIVRARPAAPALGPAPVYSGGAGAPSGVPTPGTPGTVEGRVTRDGGSSRGDNVGGTVPRGTLHGTGPGIPGSAPGAGTTIDRTTPRDVWHRDNPQTTTPDRSREGGQPAWREHVERDRPAVTPGTPSTVDTAPQPERSSNPPDWRTRAVGRGEREPGTSAPAVPRNEAPRPSSPDRGSDIPRRIIDRIGGARVYGDSGSSSRGSSGSSSSGSSAPPPRASAPPPQHSSPPPQHSTPPPPKSDDGGHVKRSN
jgi:hypothetical protein